jgi:hypothetical protein
MGIDALARHRDCHGTVVRRRSWRMTFSHFPNAAPRTARSWIMYDPSCSLFQEAQVVGNDGPGQRFFADSDHHCVPEWLECGSDPDSGWEWW